MGNECFIATPEEIDVLMDIDDFLTGIDRRNTTSRRQRP